MNDTLQHHGIVGMKWGIRRYQNKDGTLTSEGQRRKVHHEAQSQKKKDNKNKGSFSNAELKSKIERLQLEKQLRELTSSEISPGKAYVEQILKSVGQKVAVTALSGAALYAGKALVTKSFNASEFGAAIFNGGPKKK